MPASSSRLDAFLWAACFSTAAAACSSATKPTETDDSTKADTPPSLTDPSDIPIKGADETQQARFLEGDGLFDLPYRDADGLGPVYIRVACSSCHSGAARGPGLVQKMSIVEADGITPAADQSLLAYGHSIRPLTAGGGHTPVLAPTDNASVRISTRVGPAVLGRGYMEAVRDDEIERMAREQATRTDGIHGRVNHVAYTSEANAGALVAHAKGETVIGRFGLKARIATLDDFTADAFQGDMGLTTPMRPNELANPDGLLDDAKPGIDVPIATVNAVADYMRLLTIPKRLSQTAAAPGAAAFAKAQCNVCHAPSLKTRDDHPMAVLRGVDAPIYTDMLVHDLGDGLADGMQDGEAGPRDWRTAPLIGLRFDRTYLHDGRETTLEGAIRAHASTGSEANGSVAAFEALSSDEKAALVDFLKGL